MSARSFRHLLFMTALLLIVFSSGSLHCVFSCHQNSAQGLFELGQATDCHPQPGRAQITAPTSSLCHLDHSARQTQGDSTLHNTSDGQALALGNFQSDSPRYRSAEPLDQPFPSPTEAVRPLAASLALSQQHKELRSTILLM